MGKFKIPFGKLIPKPLREVGKKVFGVFIIDKIEYLNKDYSVSELKNSNFEQKFIMVSSGKGTRLSKIAKEFNVGISTIVDFLHKKGLDIESKPNTKVPAEYLDLIVKEYRSDSEIKKESEKLIRSSAIKKETITIDGPEKPVEEAEEEIIKEPEAAAKEEIEETVEEVKVKETKPKEEKAAVKEEKAAEKPDAATKKEESDKVVEKEAQDKPKTKPKANKKAEPKIEKKLEKEIVDETPVKKEEVKEDEAIAEKAVKEESAKEKEKTKKPSKKTSKEKEPEEVTSKESEEDLKVIGKIDLDSLNQKTRPSKKTKKEKELERQKKTEKKSETKKDTKAKSKSTGVNVVEEKQKKEKPSAHVEKPKEDTVVKEQVDKEEKSTETELFKSERTKLTGPTVVGKIDLPVKEKKSKKSIASSSDPSRRKKKRKRIKNEKVAVKKDREKGTSTNNGSGTDKKLRKSRVKKRVLKKEVSEEDVQKQIKDTLARLTSKGKSKSSKYRRTKREDIRQKQLDDIEKVEQEKSVLKVSEFVSVNELATMMNVHVNEVISVCMNLGLLVSINQRLDAETMSLVADEFDYQVEFMSADFEDVLSTHEDKPEELVPRSPIVTVMGHVDHGKTSLLDYIRKANVISGEAGGITQHIGAYSVELSSGKKITFLDTPGHEAFTAMRARGAKVTDVAIIVVAADDNVMPQTVEAINHASAAGVPIVFAINKIDKPGANPDKIKEELAQMNYMVEEWGGKYQSQDISAKKGENIEELLEKVMLEAEMLDLKGNPNKPAIGSVIESSLDKGRGYVATFLVESGTLKVGDIILAGSYSGHVKAMFNERGEKFNNAGPSMPAVVLGLNGAPQAGDKFNVMESEREARDIANKREQLLREQDLRTQKHITLDEIGRRLALGDFHEINVIVKGDVDGSIEALSDSLIKLSTDSIQINVIHKAVGQISESDIMLASASDAIVIGFQVRPSLGARQIAEKEQIDIRLYSIIYDAINELKDAMEGMLSPDTKEEIVATLEIREVFKITKVGTIAGCMVKQGKIKRNTKVRVIREGVVVYTGELGSLKRFKDDVKEVATGYECGLNIANFNDIKVGDMIEGYDIVEVKRTL